jgi:hypothetical protein
MQLTVTKKGAALLAADEDTIKAVRALPDGALLTREWRKVRHPKHHRLRFAWVRDLHAHLEHTGLFASPEALRSHITIAAGALTELLNPFTGEILQVPRSWRYEEMDEKEFSEMIQRAQAYLVGQFSELVGEKCGWNDEDYSNWEMMVLA